MDPDFLMPSDPTTFGGATYANQCHRLMYDRRTSSWNTATAYLFNGSAGLTSSRILTVVDQDRQALDLAVSR